MSNSQLQNVNFGPFRANVTGSSGIGYALLDENGATVSAFTTAGVYQLTSGSGLYAAYVTWPDSFNGQILWTCPPVTTPAGLILSQSYATEGYNTEESYELLSGTIAPQVQGLYDVAFGCWRIDTAAKTMTFYKGADPMSPVVAVFNLYDDVGNPTYDGVFERVLVGSVTP